MSLLLSHRILSRRLSLLGVKLPKYMSISQTRLQQTKSKSAVSGDVIPIFGNVHQFPEKVALKDTAGNYTFANLFLSARELASTITQQVDGKTNERIMFLCPNNADYVVTLWAIWMSGQIAVPLSPLHPKNILLYYASDTNARLLITTPKYVELMQRVAKNTNTTLYVLDEKMRLQTSSKVVTSKTDLETPLPLNFYNNSNALILYTSGTTGNPKGVVLTHKNIAFQINTLLEAWKWVPNDVILHTLPLHHVHGIVNALLCPLYVGAKTVMLPKFDANAVWSHLLGVNIQPGDRRITVYMAVPTVYVKLIDEYKRVFCGVPKMVDYIRNTLKNKVRLMVSGSAPLPIPIYESWLNISGHNLLERYGMTETGMCLSNLYDSDREPGYVGLPLPGVSVRLVDASAAISEQNVAVEMRNNNGEVTFKIMDKFESNDEVSGELLVKSDGVFKEYYKRPEATRKDLTADGWFRTGDVALYSVRKNKFKILGRKSTDIIKTGGYKLSAITIETELLGHPNIKECVVVGMEDKEWGQRVAAVIVLRKGQSLDLDSLKKWAVDRLPKYAIPTILAIAQEIPKNAMGKVNKRQLMDRIFKK